MLQHPDIAYLKHIRQLTRTFNRHINDKRSREQSFKPGDKVLALLPLPGHPLQARYHGPYVVKYKVGNVDYVYNS